MYFKTSYYRFPVFFKILIIFTWLSLEEMRVLSQSQLSSVVSSKVLKSCKVPESSSTSYSLVSCSGPDYCVLEPGDVVSGNGTVVGLKCKTTYMLRNEKLDFVVCYDETWYPKKHSCLKTCRTLKLKNINAKCTYDEKPVLCQSKIRVGTAVEWECFPGFRTDNENHRNYCLKNGKWQSTTMAECTPETRSVTTKITSVTDETVTVGSPIVMACDVNGYPIPTTITWHKDDQPIQGGDRTNMERKENVYFITISRTNLADGGTYKCSAENELGVPTSASISISIMDCGEIDKEYQSNYSEYNDLVDSPWIAGIYKKINGSEDYELICGATLIGANSLVTAALCVKENNGSLISSDLLRVGLGKSYKMWNDKRDIHVQKFEVTRITDGFLRILALAFVFIKERIAFNSFVRPICLDSEAITSVIEPLNGTIYGWDQDGSRMPFNSTLFFRNENYKTILSDFLFGSKNRDNQLEMEIMEFGRFCTFKDLTGTPYGSAVIYHNEILDTYYFVGVLISIYDSVNIFQGMRDKETAHAMFIYQWRSFRDAFIEAGHP